MLQNCLNDLERAYQGTLTRIEQASADEKTQLHAQFDAQTVRDGAKTHLGALERSRYVLPDTLEELRTTNHANDVQKTLLTGVIRHLDRLEMIAVLVEQRRYKAA